MVWLRAEETGDVDGVRDVIETTFGQPDEAKIVDQLRADGDLFMSHLADRKGEVIAHVAFSPAQVIDEIGQSRDIPGGLLALAPMAVLPEHQKQKIGSGLLQSALMRIERRGIRAIVVLGQPEYYMRFGFTQASAYGLHCPFDAPSDDFLIRIFCEPLPVGALHGTARYAPAFSL